MNTTITTDIYKNVGDIIPSIKAPNVTTHCLYGIEYPTQLTYSYGDSDWDNDPVVLEYVSGDGTVPEQSLRECLSWKKEQTAPLNYEEFSMREHKSILEDPDVINYVLGVVTHPSA